MKKYREMKKITSWKNIFHIHLGSLYSVIFVLLVAGVSVYPEKNDFIKGKWKGRERVSIRNEMLGNVEIANDAEFQLLFREDGGLVLNPVNDFAGLVVEYYKARYRYTNLAYRVVGNSGKNIWQMELSGIVDGQEKKKEFKVEFTDQNNMSVEIVDQGKARILKMQRILP